MKFEIMNDDVSLTMNIFLIIANIINIVYNIPQMVKTYKCKSTKDLSSWFLFLRIIGNSIWMGYAIEVDSMMMLINNIITVFSSSDDEELIAVELEKVLNIIEVMCFHYYNNDIDKEYFNFRYKSRILTYYESYIEYYNTDYSEYNKTNKYITETINTTTDEE